MPFKQEMICPSCNGTGKCEVEIQFNKKQIKASIKKLTDAKVSMKQIAKILGLSGPSHVDWYKKN